MSTTDKYDEFTKGVLVLANAMFANDRSFNPNLFIEAMVDATYYAMSIDPIEGTFPDMDDEDIEAALVMASETMRGSSSLAF